MSTDFSSIDRIVEFGLGMGLAQQMTSIMNNTMDQMKIAGVNAGTTGQNTFGQAPAAPDTRQWFLVANDKVAGPFSPDEIKELVKSGKLNDDTLMWSAGMSAWVPASNIPEINKIMLLSDGN